MISILSHLYTVTINWYNQIQNSAFEVNIRTRQIMFANTSLSKWTALFSKVGLTAMLTDMNIYNTETATKNHNLTGQTKYTYG